MTIFEVDFNSEIKNILDEISGLDVKIDQTGNHETTVPTVWINNSETDLSLEDINPRRYQCNPRIGLLIFSEENLKDWAKKVFHKIEEKRENENWEDVKTIKIRETIENSTKYYYIEVEIMFNEIINDSPPLGEAEIKYK